MAQVLARHPSAVIKKQRIKSKSRIRNKALPQSVVIILTTFLVVSVVLAFVWKNLQCVDAGYSIARLENQLQQSSKLHNELMVEYEMLCSVERIEKIAKRDLNMVLAKRYGLVPLKK